jgi:hypothetical protein
MEKGLKDLNSSIIIKKMNNKSYRRSHSKLISLLKSHSTDWDNLHLPYANETLGAIQRKTQTFNKRDLEGLQNLETHLTRSTFEDYIHLNLEDEVRYFKNFKYYKEFLEKSTYSNRFDKLIEVLELTGNKSSAHFNVVELIEKLLYINSLPLPQLALDKIEVFYINIHFSHSHFHLQNYFKNFNNKLREVLPSPRSGYFLLLGNAKDDAQERAMNMRNSVEMEIYENYTSNELEEEIGLTHDEIAEVDNEDFLEYMDDMDLNYWEIIALRKENEKLNIYSNVMYLMESLRERGIIWNKYAKWNGYKIN